MLKRTYDPVAESDGLRILAGRLSRGGSRELAKIDYWVKEIAPSDQLHKWYGHDPGKRPRFREKFFQELNE